MHVFRQRFFLELMGEPVCLVFVWKELSTSEYLLANSLNCLLCECEDFI